MGRKYRFKLLEKEVAQVNKILDESGVTFTFEDVIYEELIESDEVFFSGTAVEITPISKIDDVIIGPGSIGPITEKLQNLYSDIVTGKNDNYKSWLSLVTD